MEVPKKYEYLANNAAKQDQSKSCKPKAAAVHEAHKKALKVAKTRSKGKQRATEEDPMVVENGSGEDSAGAIQGSSKDGMVVDGGNDTGVES